VEIDGSVALVTGADRGLGQVFTRELVGRGAARVYGAARNPAAVTEPGVTPVGLDITDPERVARVAHECAGVTLLVNNAGVMKASPFIGAPGLDAARQPIRRKRDSYLPRSSRATRQRLTDRGRLMQLLTAGHLARPESSATKRYASDQLERGRART
jgi:NAD(P)-dependent dehydrogenase (short-subunit alcohol dehydrogenase family)